MDRGMIRIRVPGVATLIFIAAVCLIWMGAIAGTAAQFLRQSAEAEAADFSLFILTAVLFLFAAAICVRFLAANLRNYALLDDGGVTVYKKGAAAGTYGWDDVPAALLVTRYSRKAILLQIPGETPVLQVPFSPKAEALIGRHVKVQRRG